MNTPAAATVDLTTLTEAERLALAGVLRRRAHATKGTRGALIAKRGNQDPCPLSFAQQRLWFLAQLDERASAAYSIPGGIRLRGGLDVNALQHALDRIVQRHEALRTSFAKTAQGPVQVIDGSEVGFALKWHDLSEGGAQAEAEVARHAEEEASTAFDLERGPLIRGRLLKLAEQEHVLLVTMHHIVSDGWSMGVLVREFSALYAAFSEGRPDPLPELAIQYADFAVWQRSWIEGKVLQRQLDFWRGHLQGAPQLLELPSDRPRPAVQDFAGNSLGFELDEALSARLKSLSRRHGCTLFMTLLAAWAALLSRVSGQDEVVIGTLVANRHRAEVEPLIGFFVNTQALRIDLTARPSVAELLAQVRSTALAAQDHQDLPFEQLIEALNPERSMAHQPVFQVLFDGQIASKSEIAMPGLELQSVGSSHVTAKFDLELNMQEAGSHIVGVLAYASALFDSRTIERHVAQFTTLLQALAADQQMPVARLPLLPEAETKELRGFNATEAAFPNDRLIHQLFEEQAERTPEATALVFEDTSLSYAELNARANQLAHHLIGLGVGPDVCVAICLDRSFEMVVALLAVLKAGAAYVPFDPAYPAERLAFMLEDCRPQVLITQRSAVERLPTHDGLQLLWMDKPESAWAAQPDNNPVRALQPHHLAYVIYTSGSTGRPKGVMIEHRALVNYTVAAAKLFGVDRSDCVLQQNSITFDLSIEEMMPALVCGACLQIGRTPMLAGSPPDRASILHLTTAHWHTLVGDWRMQPAQARTQLQRVRVINVTGDAMSPQSLTHWHALGASHTTVINTYGPTETTVSCTAASVTGANENCRAGQATIGRPLGNVRIHVLNSNGQPTPIGVAGELHIAGVQLARGYLNRAELTAERFIPDPFGAPGARMYRTGDQARWRADGTIDFLGRNDHQVKLRGFRIELGEIEAALQGCAGVREAVVLAREDRPADKRLVAYVVGDEVSPEALREVLATRLPEYMVPAAYVQLAALPLTPNGKLDRKALPAPEGDAFGVREFEPPQGHLEETLAAIWSELLGLERIGRHDNFFVLGGHSLLAVQMASRVRSRLGVEVALTQLFAQPRLAKFAQVLAGAAASTLPAIVPAARNEPLPLSFAQQRLWFLAQLDERASVAYLMLGGIRLRGELNVSALQRALDRIVQRHEALRTRFVAVEGGAVQIVASPEVGFALQWIDLSESAQPEAEVAHHAEEEASTAFDLERGPLIRGRLLKLAEDEHVLLLTMHHIVSDGWSMGVLVREFSALYAAFSEGRPDPLPELAIQYADFTVWQRRWIEGEVLQRQLDFWKSALQDVPTLLEMPTDRPRPSVQDFSGAAVQFELDAGLAADILAMSRRHGATPFMTLLAAWAALLGRYCGQDDLVIGTPVAGRQYTELEPLIGFFVNTLALRFDLSGAPTAGELMDRVRSTVLCAIDQQDVPFERVIEAVHPVRSRAHNPLCQVMFSSDTTPAANLEVPGVQLQGVDAGRAVAQFDMALEMNVDGTRIVGSMVYATALFDRATIDRHIAHYTELLRAMVGGDSRAVADLPLLDHAQRERLNHWNDTQAPLDPPRCIHEAFETQAIQTPQAIAIIDGNVEISYAQLDRMANALAHQLRVAGVRPGHCVATVMARSAELVMAQLAILKVGAAYVPIEIDAPVARQTLLTSSCQAVAIVHRREHRPDWATVALLEVQVDAQALGDADFWDSVPGLALSDSAAAYVMFTSGSSGEPKGVVVPHRGVINLTRDPSYARWRPDDRFAFASNPAFDSATLEVWAPLLSGASIVVVPQPVVLDPQALATFARIHGVTSMILVAGVLRAYAPTLARELPKLRQLITGGDVADPQAIGLLLRDNPPDQLLQTYGPTETTQFVTTMLLGNAPSDGSRLPIGRPMRNMQVRVLDARGHELPVGVPGELHIGGIGVALGYLNQPDLTAERFVPDRFSSEPGARLYRTGDMGRWREDGAIEFLGRRDSQVKLRGFRIEPGEIEAVLQSHPAVQQAVIVVRADATGPRRLDAYFTTRDAPEVNPPDAAELRAHVLARLPDYMMPAAFVALEVLPLTRNGKLDLKALPPPRDESVGVQGAEEPQGEIEQALASIWCELLGVGRVGRHDDFFEIGGHSLVAVQLVSRVEARLGIRLPLSKLFSNTTLAQLAVHLHDGDRVHTEAITTDKRSKYYE